MPQAFLSHSTNDKQLVLKVRDYLDNSLVYTWIDQSNIPGGGHDSKYHARNQQEPIFPGLSVQ
jgi:hypothetical protein